MAKRSAIPGLKRLPKRDGEWTWYWAARQLVRDPSGFSPLTVRLWHGLGAPSDAELPSIRGRAARLSAELKDWHMRRDLPPDIRRAPRAMGSIYFVRAGDRVKIGYSREVSRRLSELQTFFPDPLELMLVLPGTILMEKALHARFASLSINREWFRLAEPLAGFIERERLQVASVRISNEMVQNRSESLSEAIENAAEF